MNELIITINLVRFPEAKEADLFKLLSEQAKGIEIYVPDMPNTVQASRAGIWRIIGDFNTIASLMSALLGSIAILKTELKPADPLAGAAATINNVYIQNAGHNNVYYIGRDYGTDNESLKRLNDSIAILKAEIDLERTKMMLKDIRESGKYKKIN